MKHLFFVWAFLLGSKLLAGDPPPTPESNAQREAWQLATALVSLIEKVDTSEFPGMHAWLKDYHTQLDQIGDGSEDKPFPTIDCDRLITHNPHWWTAYYETAPGDPLILGLHCTLTLAGGESQRAEQLAAISMQRPGMPERCIQIFRSVLRGANQMTQRAASLTQEGVKLHDQDDFAGALKKYDEALEICPTYALAYYEKAYSTRSRALVEAGKPLPKPGQATINQDSGLKPKIEAQLARLYANARMHNPMDGMSYQGSDQKVLSVLLPLHEKLLPSWDKIRANVSKPVSDEVIRNLAEGCDAVGIPDYALVTRQIVVARRRTYAPEDHPIISKHLRLLTSGKMIEQALTKLAGKEAKGLMFITPEGDNAPLTPD